jgi:hypothetical protein
MAERNTAAAFQKGQPRKFPTRWRLIGIFRNPAASV